MKYPRVFIGHAMYRTGTTPNFYLGMVQLMSTYPGKMDMAIQQDLSVAWAKNLLAEKFLSSKSEYLFLVDSDVGVPADTLNKLTAPKKDVIGGLVWKRKPPYEPQILRLGKDGDYDPILKYPEGVIEVDAIGGACTLWSRRVFESMEGPWFMDTDVGKSEDVFFEEKLRAKGFKFYADTTVKCSHMAEILLTENNFLKEIGEINL